MQEFHRPTIVLSFEDGLARGSGRSIPGVDLYNILQHCEDLLEGYGGHFSAVGLTLQEQHLEAFTRRFEDLVAQHLPEDDLVPTLWIDQKIGKEFTLDINFLKYFNKLQPFGKGNPEPVFSSTSLLQSPRIVGEIHLQFLWQHNGRTFKGIGFGLGKKLPVVKKQAMEFAFSLRQNTYRGESTWQACLSDIRNPSP